MVYGLSGNERSRSYTVFLAAVFFTAGVALATFAFVPLWGTFLAVIVGACFLLCVAKKDSMLYGIMILAASIGLYRSQFVFSSVPDFSGLYGKGELAGVVVYNPERSGQNQKLTVKITQHNHTAVDSFNVIVTTRSYPEYRIGDELILAGNLSEPQSFFGFDYKAYLAKDNIFAVMPFPIIQKTGQNKGNFFLVLLSKVKSSFEQKIEMMLPEPHSAFLKGILLGNKEDIPREIKEAFRVTGTTHVVALSGYNITILGRFIIGALLFATLPFRFSFWVASLIISLFILMTGASPSVVRAGIMGILLLIAEREGRIYNIRNAIAFAAAIMIFQNPLILRFDAAFQLSFLATLGIVYLAPVLENFFPEYIFARKSLWRNAAGFIKKIFIETVSAQLAVLPLLIFLFGQISLISPVTNVLVIIVIPYAMAAGFLAAVSGFLAPILSRVLAFPAWMLLEYKLTIIKYFSTIPSASFALDSVWAAPVVVIYGILILFIFFQNKKTPKAS